MVAGRVVEASMANELVHQVEASLYGKCIGASIVIFKGGTKWTVALKWNIITTDDQEQMLNCYLLDTQDGGSDPQSVYNNVKLREMNNHSL